MASSDNGLTMNSTDCESIATQDYDQIEEMIYDIGQDLSDKNISSPQPEFCEFMTDNEDGYDSFMDSDDNLWFNKELASFDKDQSCAGCNNQTSRPLSEQIDNNEDFGEYQFISIPNEPSLVQQFQQTLPLQSMTENTINNTDWCNINISNNDDIKDKNNGIKLKIWTNDWIKSCYKSLQTEHLPVLPIIADNGLIEWVKIIYIESKKIYVGIQYGHQEKELLSLISFLTESEDDDSSDLPQDLKILMMQFCTKLQVKSICLDPERVYNRHKAVGATKNVSINKFNKFKEKWVNDIEIYDISTIVDELTVDIKSIQQCFDEHDIDPLSLANYTRRDFAHLLKTYNVKFSVGLKIWQKLRV